MAAPSSSSLVMDEPDLEEYEFFKELHEQLELDPNYLETLPADKISEIAKRSSRFYGELPNRATGKYSVIALSNLQKKYILQLGLLGSIGYMYNQLKNYAPEVPEALYEHVKDNLTEKEKIKRAFWEDARTPIKKFLDSIFAFDADRHVSRIGDHVKIEDVELAYEPFKGHSDYVEVYGSKLAEILDKKVYGHEQRVKDIIHIYASSLPYEDARREYEVAKKLTSVPVYVIEEGRYVGVCEFDPRLRKEMDIDAPGNEILQQILERIKKDDELKKNILKNRVKKAKMENIKEVGPDDPEFVKRVKELYPERSINDDVFTEKEIREINEKWRMKKLEENRKADETIFPLTTIDAETGEVKQSAVYSKIGMYVADGAE